MYTKKNLHRSKVKLSARVSRAVCRIAGLDSHIYRDSERTVRAECYFSLSALDAFKDSPNQKYLHVCSPSWPAGGAWQGTVPVFFTQIRKRRRVRPGSLRKTWFYSKPKQSAEFSTKPHHSQRLRFILLAPPSSPRFFVIAAFLFSVEFVEALSWFVSKIKLKSPQLRPGPHGYGLFVNAHFPVQMGLSTARTRPFF